MGLAVTHGATGLLVDQVRAITFSSLPAAVVLVAKSCVLDWLGVTLAGSREPLTRILLDACGEASGPASIVGHDRTAAPLTAALVNGSASHALDYDDTNLVMMGHPSVPVLPALLALAETRGATGRAFLTAFVAGVETECRLAVVLGPGHYLAGWHSTGTLGTFGAAAACAHLLRLPEAAWTHALGIAGTQAAGLKSSFGTMAKPLHAGKAASNGLLSATLAEGGFTANAQILETAQGFGATHDAVLAPERLTDVEGTFLTTQTVFKYHASCYLTHSAIEATRRIVSQHGVPPDDVEHVEVHVPAPHLDVCNIQRPRTGLEAKFSLRATVALTLLRTDTSEPATFSDDHVTDPRVQALLERIEVWGDRPDAASDVLLRTTQGTTLTEEADLSSPAEDLDAQWDRLATKFLNLSAPVVGTRAARQLLELVAHMDDLADVRDVPALCRPGQAT